MVTNSIRYPCPKMIARGSYPPTQARDGRHKKTFIQNYDNRTKKANLNVVTPLEAPQVKEQSY
jgi:hypothetical protein